ncbi:TRAP transporter small permease [Roseibium sp.]|uniref:TRAP transporter small permease n=1 Tax=Roseibium sp. TaxID=1936156 RepID=UPI003A96B559
MRAGLDALYRLALGLAAACLVAIASLVVLQVFGRIIDGVRKILGFEILGLLVPSLAEICGFFLVSASFLALAGTLRRGDHIRVSLLLQHLPVRLARFFEIWCLGVALLLSGYFTWHSALQALDSYAYNEVSFGMIPIPLVIPQVVMTLGLAVFSIALLDDFIHALTGRDLSYDVADEGEAWEGGD